MDNNSRSRLPEVCVRKTCKIIGFVLHVDQIVAHTLNTSMHISCHNHFSLDYEQMTEYFQRNGTRWDLPELTRTKGV